MISDKMPSFKVVIEQPIEVHVEGSNTYRTVKTLDEAKKVGKEMAEEARQEWEERNGRKARLEEKRKVLEYQVLELLRMQKQRLWKLQREIPKQQALIDEVKDFVNMLDGIYNGTHEVQVSDFEKTPRYYFQKVRV